MKTARNNNKQQNSTAPSLSKQSTFCARYPELPQQKMLSNAFLGGGARQRVIPSSICHQSATVKR
jgi:hypothetical protein